MVLGEHALGVWPLRRDLHLRAAPGSRCSKTRSPPPSSIFRMPSTTATPETTGFDDDETQTVVREPRHGVSIREGSYFVGKNMALMQMVDGTAVIIL